MGQSILPPDVTESDARARAIAGAETELTTMGRLLEHLSRQAAAYREMSRSDYLFARAIDSFGPVSIQRLAALLRLDQATVTRRVKSMDRLGYITQSVDERDRRLKMIGLSPLGEQRMAATRAIRRQRDEVLIGDWDQADRARFAELMHQFNQSLLSSDLR